ncbi:hypothetical protein Tco_0657412 [Tanacetum coccineum]|uniref:Uncharacterized protein n=1 Tax=Tanacetum coccineum TaxID=301880 RepID=A0ABQ4XCB2_9ASTR
MKTPMSFDAKLTKDKECESVNSTKYRGMIGTTHLGLWYPKGTDIENNRYADSDMREIWDRKSTLRYLYVRGMLFDILVLEKHTPSCHMIPLPKLNTIRVGKGMSTSTMDETSSYRLRREMTLEEELWYTKSYVPTISNEKYIRIKSLLEVTATKVCITAAKQNTASIYVSTASVKLVLLVKIEENILSSYYFLYTVNAAGV